MTDKKSGPLKISRILHAGYVFEKGGTRIAFDPIFENPFSRNCYAYPDVHFDLDAIRHTRFSAVFLSHHHDDHCSLESLDLLDRSTPIYLYCLHEKLFGLIRELGFAEVRALVIDEPVEVGGVEVIPRRALDAEVDSMFHVRAGSLNILNVVDSWIDDEILTQLAKFAPWDVILWPFQTMREVAVIALSRSEPAVTTLPPEWVQQLKILNPRVLVPSSCQFRQEDWSWYNHALFPITYQNFGRELGGPLPEAQILRLNPGTSVILDGDAFTRGPRLEWVHPVGEQEIDYEFRGDADRPTTAEIARNFPALTAAQMAHLDHFCRETLVEKLRNLGPPEDPYFQKARRWRLSLFDHFGQEVRYTYRLDEENLALLEEAEVSVEWLTEVPAAKLHAALFDGESLTSMYVRINDNIFEPRTERQLAEADPLADPLIRCLFTGVVGAYQSAQLRRLREGSHPDKS